VNTPISSPDAKGKPLTVGLIEVWTITVILLPVAEVNVKCVWAPALIAARDKANAAVWNRADVKTGMSFPIYYLILNTFIL
jgi:hypothetical protein